MAWVLRLGGLLAVMALRAHASCNAIPSAALRFRGTLGSSDRPFARPGDWITLTLDAPCDSLSSSGFSGSTADNVVTVVFTPPAGGPRNVLALATDCAAVDTATCAARSDVASAACIQVNGAGTPVALERLDQRTLRFRFPDSDAQFAPAGDNLTFTGPASLAVTPAGQALPCQLASSTCSGQSGLLACVDDLFDDNGSCDATVNSTFTHFTALPLPNNYQGLCTTPIPPCTGLVDDLRGTIDAAGNALIPMDWRGILVNRDAVPVARLLRGATSVEAFEGRGVPVRIADPTILASYSPEGVRLPPLFDPQHDPSLTSTAAFFGSADAPDTVLRFARHTTPSSQCAGGSNAGLPCVSGTDCPGGSCNPPLCVGGAADGSACSVDADCPGGECGPGLFDFSTRLVGNAGPIVLRLGACIGGVNPLASCSNDIDCVGGQCGSFTFAALDPVPLDGLNQSAQLDAFIMEEAIGNPPADLNGDGDTTDHVIKLADRVTGAVQAIGSNGSEGRAITRIAQPPFTFPAVAIEGDVVAFLEPEPLQANIDANGNGNVFDTLLKVFKLGGELTDPARVLSADAAPLINGRSLAVSNNRVIFRTAETTTAQQQTTVASVTSAGDLAAGGLQSAAPSLSADGRYVAFLSDAPNLRTTNELPPDQVFADVFVHDRLSGATTQVSVTPSGTQSFSPSVLAPFISANGRHVAFVVQGCGLMPGTCFYPNGSSTQDVYVHDRDADGNGVFDEPGGITTVRISVASDGTQGNAPSGGERMSVSADGRYVAFDSTATNLVPNDTNAFCGPPGTTDCRDVFIHDRDVDGNGIFDEPGGIKTIRVSVDSTGAQANGDSFTPFLSADGRFVVFDSAATNLVPGDTNNARDVFLHDRDADGNGVFDEPGGTSTVRVSVDSTGNQGNADSYDAKISADGSTIVFTSVADNLVAGDVNGQKDVFVHERTSGITAVASVNSQGAIGNGNSSAGSLSADGRLVAFNGNPANLSDGLAAAENVFVHDRLTGMTVLVSQISAGQPTSGATVPPPWLSADGRYVAFAAYDGNLVAGDSNGMPDIFVRGPDPSSGDLTGDGAPSTTVLQVLDTSGGAPNPVISLCPADAVAVADGNVAFLRPEAAGQTPSLPLCPTGSLLADGHPDLNGNGVAADSVVHLWTGGTVENLGRAATTVALSSTWVGALVSEGAQGGTDFNGDGDAQDSVVQLHPVGGGSWINVGQAADTMAIAGDVVAFTTPESAQGATDLNGDGDAADRVLQVFDAGTARLTNVGQAAEEMVIGPTGLVAFRTRESKQGGQDLNLDGDANDDVLQVYDPVSNTLIDSGMAVTPCRLEACDPRVPYRVLNDTVTFLTLEADQGVDLNNNGNLGDLVLQVLNVRQVLNAASLAGATHTIGAVSAGICTNTGKACAGDDACGGGSCFVPPGGCLKDLGLACDPTAQPGSTANPCISPQRFCQPILGTPTQGVCFNIDGPCQNDADCSAPATCSNTRQNFHRLMNPLAPQGGGAAVFTGAGQCVEDFGTACTQSTDCHPGEFCAGGTCHRDHGVCAKAADCPTGSTCVQNLLGSTVADRDGDEIPDAFDNCPDVSNVLQLDSNGNGIGDVCEATPTVAPIATASPTATPTATPLCGNGALDPGETCDDGNRVSGDACPADCIDPAALVRGNRSAPQRSQSCQVEWYVQNPGNPPDRFGLRGRYQVCDDQDPTCDSDPTPGRCRFTVATCLNNDDPHLPACTPNGITHVTVLKPSAGRVRDQTLRSALQADAAAEQYALTHLLDPANPAAGYTQAAPLSSAQQNFCSAPFAVDVPIRERKLGTVTLAIQSMNDRAPRPQKQLSVLRLACRPQGSPTLTPTVTPTATPALVAAGSEFQVNTYTTGYQLSATAASGADGTFVVVWASYPGQDGDGYGIFGQRYNSGGTRLGMEFQVNTYTTGGQNNPLVASDATGGFVVAWTGTDSSYAGVFAQRFDSSGARRGTEFQVNTYTTYYQFATGLAAAPNGDFIVAWSSKVQDGAGWGVFARRYASNGTASGTEFQVNTYTTGDQVNPVVAMDATGNFDIVWEGQDGSYKGVFLRRYDSGGNPRGTDCQVNTYTSGAQESPSIAVDAAGGFVVVWDSQLQDGSDYGIFGQRYDSNGSAQGAEFEINTYATAGQRLPSVGADAAGNFMVVWDSYGQDGSSYGLVSRVFSSTGAPLGTEFQVNAYTTGVQVIGFAGRLAVDAAGNVVVVWNGDLEDGSGFGIFGQRFRFSGPAH